MEICAADMGKRRFHGAPHRAGSLGCRSSINRSSLLGFPRRHPASLFFKISGPLRGITSSIANVIEVAPFARPAWRPTRVHHTAGRIRAIPVQTPLLHIPVHVIQSKGVRPITPHHSRPPQIDPVRVTAAPHPTNVFISPVEVRHPRQQVRPIMKRRARPCPTRILPLRFRR